MVDGIEIVDDDDGWDDCVSNVNKSTETKEAESVENICDDDGDMTGCSLHGYWDTRQSCDTDLNMWSPLVTTGVHPDHCLNILSAQLHYKQWPMLDTMIPSHITVAQLSPARDIK